MRFLSQLAFICASIIILSASTCLDDETIQICLTPPGCPGKPWQEDLIDTQLVIQLNPLLKDHDLFGPPDTLYVCSDSTFIEGVSVFDTLYVFNPSPGRSIECSNIIDTIPIGDDAILRDINRFLYREDVDIIESFELRDSCNCDERIYLLDIPPVDLNSGIARGKSPPKKENEGTIAAAGFNYQIRPIPFDSTKLAKAVSPDTLSKRCFVNADKDQYYQMVKSGVFIDCTPVLISHPQGGPNVAKVAVIDSGVDQYYNYAGSDLLDIGASHVLTAELNGVYEQMINHSVPYGGAINGDELEQNGNCIQNDYFGYDYFHKDNNAGGDFVGHGTHVAGTILTANDELGEHVRVMPLQFGDVKNNEFKGDLFAVICALSYAVDNGADIVNMSLGYYSPYFNQPLYNQVLRAQKKNLLLVASAGNDGRLVDSCLHWPSQFSVDDEVGSNVLSVAWMDTIIRGDMTSLRLAENSNYGKNVDLAAPGTNIRSALVGSGSDILRLNGTSMAAAVVSRRAAMLMYDQDGVLDYQGAALKTKILDETVKLPNLCIGERRVMNPNIDPSLLRAIGYEQ